MVRENGSGNRRGYWNRQIGRVAASDSKVKLWNCGEEGGN